MPLHSSCGVGKTNLFPSSFDCFHDAFWSDPWYFLTATSSFLVTLHGGLPPANTACFILSFTSSRVFCVLLEVLELFIFPSQFCFQVFCGRHIASWKVQFLFVSVRVGCKLEQIWVFVPGKSKNGNIQTRISVICNSSVAFHISFYR